MAKEDENGIKVRCPYCRHIFLFKQKNKKKSSEDVVKKILKMRCPYCEASIQLPNPED